MGQFIEEYPPTSSARCERSKEVLTDVFLGEKMTVLESSTAALGSAMKPTTADQVSLWCERTQDVSGYVSPMDNTLQPSAEQVHLILNAQIENDFYVQQQQSGNSSPDFILGDQSETVLGVESDVLDNNYSELHTKMQAWLDIKPPANELNEFEQTTMIEENESFLPINSEISPIFLQEQKVEKKPSATVKKQGNLSIFDSEEPHITGDLDNSICCTDNKTDYDMKCEMDIAEEVEVTTEESGSSVSPFLFESTSPKFFAEPKVEKPDKSPLRNSSLMEMSFDLNSAFDDYVFPVALPPWVSTSSVAPSRPPPPGGLHLDIDAAMEASKQLLVGSLPDTPHLLKPVLNPQQDFDLVDFLLANGDSNNNAIVLPSPPLTSNEKQYQSRGKSQLVLQDYQRRRGKPLAAAGKSPRGKPSTICGKPPSSTEKPPTSRKSISRKPSAAVGKPPSIIEIPSTTIGKPFLEFNPILEQPESAASTSTELTVTGRPARKSASKFKRLLEEGILDPPDSQSVSSDDEDSGLRKKRRRTTSSSSSRQRLYSDSDRSSICEDAQKYRERRDRNNISSQKSRQKRKALFEQQKIELKELEEKNKRLKKRAAQLSDMRDRVHQLWKNYLADIKRK